MNITTGLSWSIWAINAFLALSFILGCRRSASAGSQFQKATAVQTFFFTTSALAFLFLDISKLHLLWVLPILFFGGSFIGMSAVPLISQVILSLTTLFMGLILIGTKVNSLAYMKRIASMSKEDIEHEAEFLTNAHLDDFTRRFMKEHGLKNEDELMAFLNENKSGTNSK